MSSTSSSLLLQLELELESLERLLTPNSGCLFLCFFEQMLSDGLVLLIWFTLLKDRYLESLRKKPLLCFLKLGDTPLALAPMAEEKDDVLLSDRI